MRRFKKKPELTFVLIPGVGLVKGEEILAGDKYARFCPSLLVELPAETAPMPVLAPASAPVTTDAEVVAAVQAHEETASAPLVPVAAAEVVAPVDVSASVETEISKPAPAPKPSAPAPKPTTGKKPPGKK